MKKIFINLLFATAAVIVIFLVFWLFFSGTGQNIPADAFKI